jgi:hypothetical protein
LIMSGLRVQPEMCLSQSWWVLNKRGRLLAWFGLTTDQQGAFKHDCTATSNHQAS